MGLKVEAPKKVGYKIVVFNLENETMSEELAKKVYKNLKNAGVSEDEFKKSFTYESYE